MKNLTARYSITQIACWGANTGAAGFATAFLMNRGLSSGFVGTLLALAGILSCLTQPVLAGKLDRSGGLRKAMVVMSLFSAASFSILLSQRISPSLSGLCYMVGIWCGDALIPLVNALHVCYTQEGYRMNYGIARGVGAGASAVSALTIGRILSQWGEVWMLLVVMGLRLVCVLTLLSYPAIRENGITRDKKQETCPVWRFFSRYRRYCVSLLGVLFLGMFHAMTETYLIAIVRPMGGNSSHVGTALFIAAMVAVPSFYVFDKAQNKLSVGCLLKTAGCAFLLKAVLFCLVRSIAAVYLLQLLQAVSYGFLAPAQVYYARREVQPQDMVKGQSFITAAYALGCAAGNFAGGQLLSWGLFPMLAAGVCMALAGTVILFLSVDS